MNAATFEQVRAEVRGLTVDQARAERTKELEAAKAKVSEHEARLAELSEERTRLVRVSKAHEVAAVEDEIARTQGFLAQARTRVAELENPDGAATFEEKRGAQARVDGLANEARAPLPAAYVRRAVELGSALTGLVALALSWQREKVPEGLQASAFDLARTLVAVWGAAAVLGAKEVGSVVRKLDGSEEWAVELGAESLLIDGTHYLAAMQENPEPAASSGIVGNAVALAVANEPLPAALVQHAIDLGDQVTTLVRDVLEWHAEKLARYAEAREIAEAFGLDVPAEPVGLRMTGLDVGRQLVGIFGGAVVFGSAGVCGAVTRTPQGLLAVELGNERIVITDAHIEAAAKAQAVLS